MFKFNNTHIFTGYLKQLLSTFNLPTCKIYTKEFSKYFEHNKKEDPRIVESFDHITYESNKKNTRMGSEILYLKNNELFSYFWKIPQKNQDLTKKIASWKPTSSLYYEKDKHIDGLTRTLDSPGNVYDTTTHEYLGEYLRFLRDYYNINLMSLYNCFNNKIYNNIYYNHTVKKLDSQKKTYVETHRIFDSQDTSFNIYAFPVKLFSNYTIAIDCSQGLEMFCGLYKTSLDASDKGIDLITRTYKKISKSIFKQPFLYDKLDVKNWNYTLETTVDKTGDIPLLNNKKISRCDILNREQDLKLFIKIPTSCKSSITVLEGDFRHYNDCKYDIKQNNLDLANWTYQQNHTVINFENELNTASKNYSTNYLNNLEIKPISKLQLLAFNSRESYPFADRLVEYLSNSAITSIDEISDNIKRVQKVMGQNKFYFKIPGVWEDKIQKIIYDYIMARGPVEVISDKLTNKGRLVDKNRGYHPRIGHTKKSTLYDILGYVDKDAEKWYASWIKESGKATTYNTIQTVDIYDGLYDI